MTLSCGLHCGLFRSLYILCLRGFYQGSSETFLIRIIREGDRGAHAKAESRDWTISLWLFSYTPYSIGKQLLFPASSVGILLKLLKNVS
jgi:hypothetical protein